MRGRQRFVVLFMLLLFSVAAAVWVSDDRENSPEAAAPVAERATLPHKESASKLQEGDRFALLLDRLQRAPMTAGELNPFGVKSWYAPPPPPPPTPPPKPTAPPLPFTFVGKLDEEGGLWVIYLTKGDQAYTVSKGETFDSVYRLEGIENGNLVIQYLPLSIKQLLPVGVES